MPYDNGLDIGALNNPFASNNLNDDYINNDIPLVERSYSVPAFPNNYNQNNVHILKYSYRNSFDF